MGKFQEHNIALGNLIDHEDDNGLELTLGLSQWGSKSKCSIGRNSGTLNDLKQVDEHTAEGSADSLLGLFSREKTSSGSREPVSDSIRMQGTKCLNPGQVDHALLPPKVFEKTNQEDIAEERAPGLYAQQLLKSLQEKAQTGLAAGQAGGTDQIAYHAAAATAAGLWAQFAPGLRSMLAYEKLEESCEATATGRVPGMNGSLACDSPMSVSTTVKPLAQLSTTYSSKGVDAALDKKHEVFRTVSLDRIHWQTVTNQQQLLEQQRKTELYARQEARKKRRSLIDEQKQHKRLARGEDEKPASNSAKASLQIPGSSAPRGSLQGRDLLNCRSGGEAGAMLLSSTSPSNKIIGNCIALPKKLDRKQTSSSSDVLNEDVEQLRELRHASVREREKASEREMESESTLVPEDQTVSSISAELSILHRTTCEQVDSRRLSPVEAESGPRIGYVEDPKSDIVDFSVSQALNCENSMIDHSRKRFIEGAPSTGRYEDVRKEATVNNNLTERKDFSAGCRRDEKRVDSGIGNLPARLALFEESKSNSTSGEARGSESLTSSGCQGQSQLISAGGGSACTERAAPASFLHMQPAYFPMSNNCVAPSLMPIPYPYFFQCVVPTSGAAHNQVPSSFGGSPYQNSISSFPRFSLSTWEAHSAEVSTAQSTVQASHSVSGSSAKLKGVSSKKYHESATDQTDQGVKVGQNVDVCRPVSSKEPPKGGISALLRAASLNSVQSQGCTLTRSQPPFAAPQSASVTSAIPAVGLLQRTQSEPPEILLHRQGSESSPFASLVAAVEASQGLSAAVASVSKSSLQGARRNLECSSFKSTFDRQEKTFGRQAQPKGSFELGWSDIRKSPGIDEVKEKKMQHGGKETIQNQLEIAADPDQEGISERPAGSKGPFELSWFDIRTSPGSDEEKEKKTELSRKEPVPNLEVAADPAQEGPRFRAGLAVGDFSGGSESSPYLHLVSTTGTGPNGKTITGVLYRYVKGEVKILCACHGEQMSPGEFVRHAGGDDVPNPEKSIVVNPIPYVGEAAPVTG